MQNFTVVFPGCNVEVVESWRRRGRNGFGSHFLSWNLLYLIHFGGHAHYGTFVIHSALLWRRFVSCLH